MLNWRKVLSITMLTIIIAIAGITTVNDASPPSSTGSLRDKKPNNGGEWWKATTTKGDTVTDATTAAGIASALVGGVPGITAKIISGSGGVASAIAALNIDTTYYTQYKYVESTPISATMQTAIVTYYYSESNRGAKHYVGSTVHMDL